MGLGEITGPPTDDRSIEGLGGWHALVKWKSSVLLCSMKERISVGIFSFRVFNLFLNIFMTGAR